MDTPSKKPDELGAETRDRRDASTRADEVPTLPPRPAPLVRWLMWTILLGGAIAYLVLAVRIGLRK